MKKIPFIKIHGLGNDFIIINLDDFGTNINAGHDQNFIKKISDRNIGIGCDQLIYINDFAENSKEMIIYNSNGTRAKACGNASRAASFLHYQKTGSKNLLIKIFDREIFTQIKNDLPEVNMGKVSFKENWMPQIQEIQKIIFPYEFNKTELICADIGNPHLIIFNQNFIDKDFELIASTIQKSQIFPDGVNVNFVTIKNKEIHLKVWERGVGFTLACGSGACASFASAIKLGYLENKSDVVFKLGKLRMHIHNENIFMCGAVEKIAEGVYFYE